MINNFNALSHCLASLDAAAGAWQYNPAACNSAAGFSRLRQRGRHAALSHELRGFFTSAYHAIGTPFYGGRWRGGFAPAGTLCRSANPAICPPPLTFSSVNAALPTKEKGNTMITQQQGITPVYTRALRTFPTLAAASRHVDLLLERDSLARFLIQQTRADRWQVSRVIGGAA